ncbi:hypothetical protein AGMMS4957_03240 [Bacteroidia bacterium]|nr:hypothetical protein AGMMS4957_03240 [Bacteroidia bacterium]
MTVDELLDKKFGASKRFVDVRDAAFILELRLNERLARFLSPTGSDVKAQEQWIERYKLREKNNDEFYFVFCDTATGRVHRKVKHIKYKKMKTIKFVAIFAIAIGCIGCILAPQDADKTKAGSTALVSMVDNAPTDPDGEPSFYCAVIIELEDGSGQVILSDALLPEFGADEFKGIAYIKDSHMTYTLPDGAGLYILQPGLDRNDLDDWLEENCDECPLIKTWEVQQ